MPKDGSLWCMWIHLSSLLLLLGIPFINVIAPLVLWQIKKNEFPELNHHGRESVNFQITATLAFCVLTAGLTLSMFLTAVLIGFLLLPVIGLLMLAVTVAWFILVVVAAVKANNGEAYRYPWTIRFIQ